MKIVFVTRGVYLYLFVQNGSAKGGQITFAIINILYSYASGIKFSGSIHASDNLIRSRSGIGFRLQIKIKISFKVKIVFPDIAASNKLVESGIYP